jgi:hypothetical protein
VVTVVFALFGVSPLVSSTAVFGSRIGHDRSL